MLKHIILAMTLLLVSLYALCPAREEPQLKRYTFTEVHMGTEFKIILYAPSKEIASKAAKAAFARIAELDHIMSDYQKTSELRQLCKKAGGPPVHVSKDLFNVLSRAQALAKKTNGAFDVTVGPVVKLWRRSRRTRQLPEAELLKKALAKVGYQKIRLNAKQRTVQLVVDGMMLDLGGIAKGYAADAALEVLRRFGITRALVAASGDIAVSDPPPDKKDWKIGIGRLKNPKAPPKYYLALNNAAVSTSGDVEQYVTIKGKRYSHIVNPRTGLGLVGRSSVTVIAPHATTTDSTATALSVLGPKKGLPLIDGKKGTAALIVRENDKGKLETIKSKRFSEFEYRR